MVKQDDFITIILYSLSSIYADDYILLRPQVMLGSREMSRHIKSTFCSKGCATSAFVLYFNSIYILQILYKYIYSWYIAGVLEQALWK